MKPARSLSLIPYSVCRKTAVRALVACLLAAWTLPPAARAQDVVPANTVVEVRLTHRLDTRSARKGSPVEAILAAPLIENDEVVVPAGSKVLGTVVDKASVGLGFVHEIASIAVQLDRIVLPDGSSLTVSTRVAQIENSRETVDKKNGKIRGVRSTSTLSHKVSGAVGTLAFSNPVALIFTTASSASILRFSDPEISLPAEAELVLLTTAPFTVAAPAPDAAATPPLAATPEEQKALRAIVRHEPFRTVTVKGHVPSDITNLMFVGSNDAILRAFTAAGWLQVSSLDADSTYKTIRSISEQQAYRTAPMSTLLLEDRPPVDALAKTLDTFSKRHHLRVFATSDEWQGQPVFVSSSTQDVGIGFAASQKNFIHQIDHHIDHERNKVVNDLLLTGCVTAMNLVERSWLPREPKNGTGEPIVTDGRMAVLRLNDCVAPLNVADRSQTAAVPMHSNIATQATRQTVLSLRDMFTRDNVGVSAYGLVKNIKGIKHPLPPEAPLVPESSITIPRYAIGTPADEPPAPELIERTPTTAPAGTVAAPRPRPAGARFAPASIELGIHGGLARYAGGNGGDIIYLFQDLTAPNDPPQILDFGNVHENGWNLGGTVTFNHHNGLLSSEFSFDYNHTPFDLYFAQYDFDGTEYTTDPTDENAFEFDPATLATTEVAYNLLVHPRPGKSRFQPYVFAGPSLRLMHLADAPIKKASPWFKLGLSTVGSVIAAYQEGAAPALDGGGIFQVGLQYGAGIKYRVSRHWLYRIDYKETLSAQPDFWSKSTDDIFDELDDPGYDLSVDGPFLNGKMRQQRITSGFSFVF